MSIQIEQHRHNSILIQEDFINISEAYQKQRNGILMAFGWHTGMVSTKNGKKLVRVKLRAFFYLLQVCVFPDNLEDVWI